MVPHQELSSGMQYRKKVPKFSDIYSVAPI